MGKTLEVKSMDEFNLIITGVGGQGLITLGRIIGETAVRKDVNALISEIHGMAQRGGQVVVHIRIGSVNSPLVPLGGANAILGLELIELARNLKYANMKTVIVANNRVIRPSIPRVKLPSKDSIVSALKSKGLRVIVLNALELAIKAGAPIVENMVMLGALIASTEISRFFSLSEVEEVLKSIVPERYIEVNIKALKLGYDEASKLKSTFIV